MRQAMSERNPSPKEFAFLVWYENEPFCVHRGLTNPPLWDRWLYRAEVEHKGKDYHVCHMFMREEVNNTCQSCSEVVQKLFQRGFDVEMTKLRHA